MGFNPHPTSRLGAAAYLTCRLPLWCVSILTQPLGWVQPPELPADDAVEGVSILTQPLGWVQLLFRALLKVVDNVSILTQPLGWVQHLDIALHPVHRVVSILTQPLGWVQLLYRRMNSGRSDRFNPHPTSRLGAAGSPSGPLGPSQRFQSSPNLSAGCSRFSKRTPRTLTEVSILTQPLGWVQHPDDVSWVFVFPVSILTQPLGWVQRT